MSVIKEILVLDNVVLQLDAGSKKRAFELAGELFEKHNGLDRQLVFDSLFARERLGTTGIGSGVAIPHGRIKGLEEAQGAFMTLQEPIQFDAPDGKLVRMLFVLLVPEQANEKHLKILAELARIFSQENLLKKLEDLTDTQAAYEMLTQGG